MRELLRVPLERAVRRTLPQGPAVVNVQTIVASLLEAREIMASAVSVKSVSSRAQNVTDQSL